jgi:hypothetical protein
LAGRATVPSSVTKVQWDRENWCVAAPAGVNWQSPTTASHCEPRHKSPEWQELQSVCLSVYMMWVPILFVVASIGLADRFGAPTRPTLLPFLRGVFPQPPCLAASLSPARFSRVVASRRIELAAVPSQAEKPHPQLRICAAGRPPHNQGVLVLNRRLQPPSG